MCCVLIISHQNPEELAIIEAEENLPNRVYSLQADSIWQIFFSFYNGQLFLIISHQNPEELAIIEAEENLPNRVCLERIVRRAARPTRQLLNYRWALLDQLCLERS